jgi:hypothetical protein
MKVLRMAASITALIVMVSGCLVIDEFSAAVEIHPDFSYDIAFTGKIINYLIYSEYGPQEESTPEDNVDIEAIMSELLPMEYFTKADHLGKGVYDVQFENQYDTGTAAILIDQENSFLLAGMDTEGGFVVMLQKISADEAATLADVGIVVDGTFEVITRLAVTEHDADEVRNMIGGKSVISGV